MFTRRVPGLALAQQWSCEDALTSPSPPLLAAGELDVALASVTVPEYALRRAISDVPGAPDIG